MMMRVVWHCRYHHNNTTALLDVGLIHTNKHRSIFKLETCCTCHHSGFTMWRRYNAACH